MELCKFYLIIKLCLLIFQFNQINCESEYELDCLNEDCSDMLSEGFNQFEQFENDALLRLGKNEHISIYGENKDYYLIKSQNRQGLVKRNYVRVEKSLKKDKQFIKIRASFKDKKLNVINSTKIDEQTNESINLKLSKTNALPNNDQLDQQDSNDLTQLNNTKNSLPLHENEKQIESKIDLESKISKNYDDTSDFNKQELKNKTTEQKPIEKNDQQSSEYQTQNFTNEKSIEIDEQAKQLLNFKIPDVDLNNDSLSSSNSSTIPLSSEENLELKINNTNSEISKNDTDEIFNKQELQNEKKQSIEKNDQQNQHSESSLPNLDDQKKDIPNDSRLNPNNYLNRKNKKLIKNKYDISIENNNDILNHQIENQLDLEMPKIELNLNDEKSEINEKQQQNNVELNNEEIQNNVHLELNQENSEQKNEPQNNMHLELNQENSEQKNEEPKNEKKENNENQNNDYSDSTIAPSSLSSDEKLNSNIFNPNVNQVDSGIPKNYNDDDLLSASNQQTSQNNLPDTEQQTQEQRIQDSQLPTEELKETPKELHLHPKKFLGTKAKIKQLNKDNQEQLNTVDKKVESNDNLMNSNNDNPIHSTSSENSMPSENLDYLLSSPDNQIKKEEEQLNLYISGLRYTLGSFVNLLPEGMVLFLEQGLQISTRLLIFVFIIGLLWIVLFAIKLFYISLSNETVLKNQLCESQSKLSQIQRERDDLKTRLTIQNSKLSKGLEEQKCEVDRLINKLNHDNKQLKDSKLLVEKELNEKLNLVKNLEIKIEQLNVDNCRTSKKSEELNEKLNEELQIKENLINKLTHLEELNKELISKNDELENQIKDKEFEIDNLTEKLDEKEKSITDKDVEIGFLNKMLDELKKSNELLNHRENSESIDDEDDDKENQILDDQTNFYDVVKLRFEIEKLEKERNDSKEKLKISLDKIKVLEDKLENLELEFNENKEMNSKIIKEKEEAEKYLDFLKKYYNENKNDLQKELGVYQYKEKQLNEQNKELKLKLEELQIKVDENDQRYQTTKKEFDDLEKQLKDELSISNKSACDYFKSVQSLRVELTNAKKENEYLRQQLRNPSASSSTTNSQILPPPEMPKAVLDFFGQLSSGQIPPVTSNPITASGLINLNNLNNFNNSNFMTAPSPIPNAGPQSIDYQQTEYQQNDYQQNDYQQPSYHSSFSHLPFTSQQQQQSQNLTSIYNNTITTSAAMNSSVNFNQQQQQIIDPLMLNQHDNYVQQDYHYTSLPNMSYNQQQHQQPNNLINQQWNLNNMNNQNNYTTTNEENNTTTSNSPHPSLHSNV